VEKPSPRGQQEHVEHLITKSQRMRVPIRNTFVQKGTGSESTPGALSQLVRHHDELGLDLYLLILMAATKEPHDVVYPAGTWARSLAPHQAVSTVRVSKALARLEKLKLIKRRRSGRLTVITLLNEDGSGDPYTRPMMKGDFWLQVPVEYWHQGWYRKLSFAAKAMLLIALHRGPGFTLPAKKGAKWYGISADTIESGLAELEKAGLLDNAWAWRVDDFAPEGVVRVYMRTLKVPFDRATRNRRRTVVQRKGVRMELVK
jgi:DNA-binding IscR family transcriptional regulator